MLQFQRLQCKHAWKLNPFNIRFNQHCSGPDDKTNIFKRLRFSVFRDHTHLLFIWIDGSGCMIEQQANAFVFNIGSCSVGQCFSVPDLATKVKRWPADAEVRILVGDDDGHFELWINFFGTQRRADTGIAAPDDENALHILFSVIQSGSFPEANT